MATIQVQIDDSVQAEAAETLATMGLSVTDVVRMLLENIATEHSLPFAIPNAETIQAMLELKQDGQKRFNSIESLIADLNADD
jgi:DNA-damage-inducible protein J